MMAAGGLISTVRRVISEEMNKEGVLQEDVPEDPHINPSDVQQVKNSVGRRYYRCKAFAHFDEHVDEPDQPNQPEQPDRACEHTWKSAHAWCVLDLKKQRIAYRWCQECNQCEGESEPWFDEAALKRMAEYAVKRFKGVKTEKKEDGNPPEMGPHDERRCDMCKQLGHSCWKKPTYSYPVENDQDEDEDDQYYDDEYGDPYDDDGAHDDDYDDAHDDDSDPYDYDDTHDYDYNDAHDDDYDLYDCDYGDTYDDEYDPHERGYGDDDPYNSD